jgi:hypothetical protein
MHAVRVSGIEEDLMIEQSIDVLTRRAALLGVGVGLPALAGPLAAGARKNKTKKIKKKAKNLQKCQNQVGQCEAVLLQACAGEQWCIDAQLPCCAALATCDLLGLYACINAHP